MATGDPLPDEHHVARYCAPRTVQNGVVLSTAFNQHAQDAYLSVNWLEFFDETSTADRIAQIRGVFERKGFGVRQSGRFVVLGVGTVLQQVLAEIERVLRILHCPLEDDDPHAGIFEVRADDLDIQRILASLVTPEETFDAIPSPQN